MNHRLDSSGHSHDLPLKIRKEIRSLSDTELTNFVHALNTMKFTPTHQGRRVFGNAYTSYDDFVSSHMRAAQGQDGDASTGDDAHHGANFLSYHRQLLIEFERSLSSVVAGVALPYWNISADGLDPASSPLWSEKFLGSRGNASNGYAPNGFLAKWLVPRSPDSRAANRLGYIRGSESRLNVSNLVRFGKFCGVQITWSQSHSQACLQAPDITEFARCMQQKVHLPVHAFLGGAVRRIPGKIVEECSCPWESADGSPPEVWQSCLEEDILWGDYADRETPINDPVFFLHHADVDRWYRLWQLEHSRIANDGFPVSGQPQGGNLYDTVTPAAPFLTSVGTPMRNYDIINQQLPYQYK
eukprot:CAMPEP_0115845174 /NCGR_PEP_ID=MMETSP0287-20121206/9216_1 /TAXON_ID=412157 /ORGANISM="Chrysochromulina rotalis, Strain UIO044" /LENGTH=355 /DNA_ID=CAMNT_0003298939 /DNA_START=183 /DNA_END=1250 /DNA_ORIENTATION=-